MTRLRVDTSDARSAARKVTAARFAIPTTLRHSQRQLADGAVTVYRRHAPTRTNRLHRGIRVVNGGSTYIVRADAKNPQTGYDYTGVTRKGHRRQWITPRRDRSPASVIATGGARAQGRRAALRFVIGGQVFYRRRVRGYKPDSDWSQDARPEVLREGQSAQRDLSRRIGALFG